MKIRVKKRVHLVNPYTNYPILPEMKGSVVEVKADPFWEGKIREGYLEEVKDANKAEVKAEIEDESIPGIREKKPGVRKRGRRKGK